MKKDIRIGLIGLGIMGRPMAKNILKAGYNLTVNDLNPSSVGDVCKAGAETASNEEIGRGCDVVLTMLPDSPQVKEVVLGKNGLAEFMREGSVLIDMSSINPMVSKVMAQELGRRKINMLDAPVSGGEPKAVDGTLSFMVGGPPEVFDAYRELLGTMGASVVRCGDIGAGNTTKLANQIIVACNIQAVAEALQFAQKAGVKPCLVFEAIKGGLAGSTVMDAKAPMMMEGNDKPGFKVHLHVKDLKNALECAHAVGAYVPMTANVQEVLQWLTHRGCGQDDHSSISKFYEEQADIKIGR